MAPPPRKTRMAVAIYNCIGDDDSELTFNAGDIIYDVREAENENEGWLYGRIGVSRVPSGALEGLFPANYVKLVDEELEQQRQDDAEAPPALPARPPPVRSNSGSDDGKRSLNPIDTDGYMPIVRPSAKDKVTMTRMALMEQSKSLVQSALDSASESGSTQGSPVLAAKKYDQAFPVLYTHKKSGSTSSEARSTPLEIRRKVSNPEFPTPGVFEAPMLPARPPAAGTTQPDLGKRPPLLTSNQSLEAPPTPPRADIVATAPATLPAKKVAPPPPPSKPSELKNASPNPSSTNAAIRPSDILPANKDTDSTVSSIIKPSEIFKATKENGASPWSSTGSLKPSDIKAAKNGDRKTPSLSSSGPGAKQIKSGEDDEVDTTLVKPSDLLKQHGTWVKGGTNANGVQSRLQQVVLKSTNPFATGVETQQQSQEKKRPAPPPPPSKTSPIGSPKTNKVGNGSLPRPKPPPPPPSRKATITNDSPEKSSVIPALHREWYMEAFDAADSDGDGVLDAEQVRSLWLRSGLDHMTLGMVWRLVDVRERMALNRSQFCVGMHLIDERLRGNPVPMVLTADLSRELQQTGR